MVNRKPFGAPREISGAEADRVKLWQTLYLMIWLAFFEFISVYVDIPGFGYETEIHILLGVVMIIVGFINLRELRKTTAPARLKRIAGSTAAFTIVQAILAIPIALEMAEEVARFLHLVVALAIITQASSVATAYDMWEEKEFLEEAT